MSGYGFWKHSNSYHISRIIQFSRFRLPGKFPTSDSFPRLRQIRIIDHEAASHWRIRLLNLAIAGRAAPSEPVNQINVSSLRQMSLVGNSWSIQDHFKTRVDSVFNSDIPIWGFAQTDSQSMKSLNAEARIAAETPSRFPVLKRMVWTLKTQPRLILIECACIGSTGAVSPANETKRNWTEDLECSWGRQWSTEKLDRKTRGQVVTLPPVVFPVNVAQTAPALESTFSQIMKRIYSAQISLGQGRVSESADQYLHSGPHIHQKDRSHTLSSITRCPIKNETHSVGKDIR
jgi:hypothetical protein